jgi:hypothetical protein
LHGAVGNGPVIVVGGGAARAAEAAGPACRMAAGPGEWSVLRSE